MELEPTHQHLAMIFMWGTILSVALFTLSSVAWLAFRGPIRALHARWFGLRPEVVDVAVGGDAREQRRADGRERHVAVHDDDVRHDGGEHPKHVDDFTQPRTSDLRACCASRQSASCSVISDVGWM